MRTSGSGSASETALTVPEGVQLEAREVSAYRYWLAKDEPPVAPSTQAQFFQLFLAGKSCEEIRRLNPGFSLGSIVAARLKGRWDEERDLYLAELLGRVRQRVQQTTLETVELLCDAFAAKNKLYRDKLLKFIQTGDEAALADLDLKGFKGYKELAEALMKLTGQDGNRKVSGSVNLVIDPPAAARPVTPEQGAGILAALAGAKRERDRKAS